jgi:general secretion pathway protein G
MAPSIRSSSKRFSARSVRAFTLIEILVVLAILGMLAGLAITNFDTIFGGARDKTAELFVNQTLKVPLRTYQMQVGDFPSTAEGLAALITAPSGKADRWRGPYVDGKAIPLDPWGRPYQYRYPGTKNKSSYDLFSFGPSGTEDEKSIGNW